VTLGRLHDASGKYDLAVQEFQQALQLDPRNAEALGGLSRAYESAGRVKEAEEALQKAVALRPDYWDVYNNLALFYDRQNRFDEAIAQLQKAIQLTPDNPQLYLNLGAVYSDTGKASDLTSAEAALKKSIELAPTYAAYANLGFVNFLEGRYRDAAASTERALQMNDQNYMVWRNLAEIYAWDHQTAKSARAQLNEMELLAKEAERRPQDAELVSELAPIYAKQGQPEKALAGIHKALALAPENATVLMNAAEVSEVMGKRAEAIRYAEQGLQKGFSLDDLKRRYALQSLLRDSKFKPPANQ
jgi:Flp pilus assembly protein TadD